MPPDSETAAPAHWSRLAVIVVGTCFLLNMLDGTDLLILSYVAPVIAREWLVSAESLGALFGASLAGMAIGCVVVAPLGDRFGRRRMIIGALALISASMVASALATTVTELMLARVGVGVGVGTVGVSMTALTAEYAPRGRANFAVGFVQAGWPLGSIVTALIVARVLPGHTRQSMFLGVAIASAGLLLLVHAALPESADFLMLGGSKRDQARLAAIERRLGEPMRRFQPVTTARRTLPLRALFAHGRARPSAVLWTAVMLGYFVLYFVISWIPKLATQAGWSLEEAIYAGGAYNLGAFLGTIGVGWIATRCRPTRVVATFLMAASPVMIGYGVLSMPLWLTLTFAAAVGITVQGGFNGFWILAARLYPTEIRSTGVGWALGIGRIGAVLGPVVGGTLVGARLSLGAVFVTFAVPSLLAGILVLWLELPTELT